MVTQSHQRLQEHLCTPVSALCTVITSSDKKKGRKSGSILGLICIAGQNIHQFILGKLWISLEKGIFKSEWSRHSSILDFVNLGQSEWHIWEGDRKAMMKNGELLKEPTLNFSTYLSHIPYYKNSRKGAAADSEGDAIFLFHLPKKY